MRSPCGARQPAREDTLWSVGRVIVLLLAVLALAGCGGSSPKASAPNAPPVPISNFKGLKIAPRPAPAIALHDASGKPYTLAAQRGSYTLVTFIYTKCPDVCPLITANLNATLRLIGARAHRVDVLAVSVDPKGDTPAAVRAYATRMHLVPQFHYLIGTSAQLRKVWNAWQVEAVSGNKAIVDHVAYTALVDPAGKERLIYDAQTHAADIVHDLHLLMQKPATS